LKRSLLILLVSPFSQLGSLDNQLPEYTPRLVRGATNSILAIMNAGRYQLSTIPWNPVFFDLLWKMHRDGLCGGMMTRCLTHPIKLHHEVKHLLWHGLQGGFKLGAEALVKHFFFSSGH
jgi:hypothetical protein